MKPGSQVTAQEVEAVIARGSQIRRAPDVVRARLLARARNAVARREAAAVPVAGFGRAPPRSGIRIAVAATVLLAFAAGGAAAMIHSGATRADALAVTPSRAAAPISAPPRVAQAPAELPAPRVASSRPRPSHRVLSPQESYAAELELLRRAQSNYASHDFSDALVLVAEHARRFPKGRLAEEREALRVRSLAGAGRGDEARRVLAAFARRFPRSVLLARLQEAARTAEE
jgi:hypothetical protein